MSAIQPHDNWIGGAIPSIFFQGFGSSQIQAAKYCGTRGLKATTGETVVCKTAFDVIQDAFIGKELDEIDLQDMKGNQNLWIKTQQMYTSLGVWWHQMVIHNNPQKEKSVFSYALDTSKVNVAQEGDIAEHAKKVEIADHMYGQDCDKILFGVSRGAATTFNAMAMHHYKNVKLVVLEGCPKTVRGVFEGRYGFLAPALYDLFTMVTNHNPEGPSPDKLVDDFPEGVPVAFITSAGDASVPASETMTLATKLNSRKKNPVFLLVLRGASHPHYMDDDEEDRRTYQNFLHALYKAYNLPHIEAYAKAGGGLLEKCLLQ